MKSMKKTSLRNNLSLLYFLGTLSILGCTSATVAPNSKNHHPLDLTSCTEGTTRQGFLTPTTSGDTPCTQGTQTCMSGKWQGPTLFPSCDNFTKSCDGQPHGSVVTGFLQPTSPKGIPCTPATKTCLNGSWSGPKVYPSCTEP